MNMTPLLSFAYRTLLSLVMLMLVTITTPAADLYWDGGAANISTNGDGLSAGGAGTWSTAITNWDAGADVPHTNWVNANLDNAIFGGTGANIALTNTVNVNQMKFLNSGVNIGQSGAGYITFGGSYNDTTPTIDASGTPVGSSVTFSRTITGNITGGLVVAHNGNMANVGSAGRVYFATAATNNFVGDITVVSGWLHALSSLGNPANKVFLKGGGILGNAGLGTMYVYARDVVVSSDSYVGINQSGGTGIPVTINFTNGYSISGPGNLTRNANGSTEVRLSGDMSGYTGVFQNVSGLTTIQTTAASAGGWVLNGGTLKLNTNNDTHISNGVGKPNLEVNGGTLDFNGRSETINGLAGGGGLVQNNLTNSDSILTLGDANTTAAYGGTIRNNGGTGGTLAVVKIGSGTQTVSGTNQCAGYTVAAGTLEIGDGFSDSPFTSPITNNAAVVFNVGTSLTYGSVLTGTGMVTKNGGGWLTLAGSNSYSGATVLSAGKLTLLSSKTGTGAIFANTPGAELEVKLSPGAPTLTADSASVNNVTLDLNLNGNSPGATAPLTVTGSLTNSGSTVVNILNFGPLSLGSFPLIKYGNFLSNDFSGFNLNPLGAGVTATLQNNPGNGSIDLVITALSGLKWTGATDTNWDNTTLNWVNTASAAPSPYTIGSFALFDDSGTNTAIWIATDPQPASLTVSNETRAYSFNGTAGIGGPAALVKQGAGLLTVAVNNNNSGGTLIQKGTLQVGDGTVDGTIAAPITDNGALVYNVAFATTASSIAGTGTVAKAGAGQLTLGGGSTYTGATTVEQGLLYVTDSAALGATNSGTTVQSGAELRVDASGLNIPEALTLGGSGARGVGALVVNSGASTWSGSVTASADTTFGALAGASLTLAGELNGGNHTLTFAPESGGAFLLTNRLTAGKVLLNEASGMVPVGGLLLAAANESLTNLQVLQPVQNVLTPPATAGLWARHSLALGTNSTVLLTNSQYVGGTGARLGLDNNVSIPGGVSLVAYCPGDGLAGQGGYRCALSVVNSTTNTWNGPITIHGADPALGVTTYFVLSAGNSGSSGRLVLNGDLSIADGSVILLPRGWSSGQFNGKLELGTNTFQVTDGARWTVASTGNTWGETYVSSSTATLALGTPNALCTTAPLRLEGRFEPDGFNQEIAGLYSTTATGVIVNHSTNAHSTLTVRAAGNLTYGGALLLSGVFGSKQLGLDIASGGLTLTNNGNSYAGPTVIRSGATLALLEKGDIQGSDIEIQAGGTFDVSGRSATIYAPLIPAGYGYLRTDQALTGNGTVTGSITNTGTIAPGSSVGTLAVSAEVGLGGGGTVWMEVNNTTATADLLSVGGTLTYGGTLVVSNVSAIAYTNNQVIKLFNAAVYTGAFANIVFPGVSYDASQLVVDGTIKVLSSIPTTPTNITVSVSGGSMTLSWPASYTGWRLEAQTNSLSTGLSNNWATVPGSTSVNSVVVPLNPANAAVFYRLVYP